MSETLEQLHQDVSHKADQLSKLLGERLQCRKGCSACCVDDLTVFQIEADRIREAAARLPESAQPGPIGACVFLDAEGACRVYEARPYVCRTQGLPLRWFEEDEAWTLHEYRDICPLNDRGEPLESLPETHCWTIGEVEGRLAQRQQERYGNQERIALRQLWPNRSV